jgi:hypothetical protein
MKIPPLEEYEEKAANTPQSQLENESSQKERISVAAHHAVRHAAIQSKTKYRLSNKTAYARIRTYM